MENNEIKPVMGNDQPVERTPIEGGQDDKFDKEGAPRKLWTMPGSDATFYGSEKEFKSHLAEETEVSHDNNL